MADEPDAKQKLRLYLEEEFARCMGRLEQGNVGPEQITDLQAALVYFRHGILDRVRPIGGGQKKGSEEKETGLEQLLREALALLRNNEEKEPPPQPKALANEEVVALLSLKIEDTPLTKRHITVRGLRYVGECNLLNGSRDDVTRPVKEFLAEHGLGYPVDYEAYGWKPPYWEDEQVRTLLDLPLSETLRRYPEQLEGADFYYWYWRHRRGFYYTGEMIGVTEHMRRNWRTNAPSTYLSFIQEGLRPDVRLRAGMLIPWWQPPRKTDEPVEEYSLIQPDHPGQSRTLALKYWRSRYSGLEEAHKARYEDSTETTSWFRVKHLVDTVSVLEILAAQGRKPISHQELCEKVRDRERKDVYLTDLGDQDYGAGSFPGLVAFKAPDDTYYALLANKIRKEYEEPEI